MRLAIIDKKNSRLKVEPKSIKIDEQNIPFSQIDVIIISQDISLKTSEIIKISSNSIPILLLNNFNNKMSIINGFESKNGDLKIDQYKAFHNRIKIAKWIIKEKIISHKEQLKAHDIILDIQNELNTLEQSNRIDTIMGIEGSFARKYFDNFFSLLPKKFHKSKRTKNPPLDPVNSVMSFFYMVYYNIITTRLLSFGFEPAIGYLHEAYRGHNALASDFMEFFRADINHFVIIVFKNNTLTTRDFIRKNGVFLNQNGKKKLWKIFSDLIAIMNPKLNEKIATLRKIINENS
jgi:CRISPR-associated protein Cas1